MLLSLLVGVQCATAYNIIICLARYMRPSVCLLVQTLNHDQLINQSVQNTGGSVENGCR